MRLVPSFIHKEMNSQPHEPTNHKPMKPRTPILKTIAALCASLAVTSAFGQATIIWDGGAGTAAIGAATNWVGDVSPNSAAGDICQWDSLVPGNLFLTAGAANGGFNNGTPGVNFYITAGHTGSWNLSSLIAGGSANIALNATTIDSGAGAFSLGDGTANVLNIILRPSSSGGPPNSPIHTNLNNSANAATIFPNVRYQSGGGNPHVVQFDGAGDWIVNNALNNANAGNNNNFLIKMGSGTMFWNANSIAGAAGVNGIGSPIQIEGGRLVLTATTTILGTQRITNNATLQYAANGAQTLSGPMNGIGNVVVSAGTLTLSSSQSDWTGNIVLTNGGVLVVGGTQNDGGTGPLGINRTIFFNGGTLQFSTANTFDYSPSFSTAANQAYSINSGGQNVTFTNALTSSGGTLTKLGSGTLTLTGANTYSGTTVVGAGKLELLGTAGTGAIIVSNSTALGVNQGGAQIAPSTLTVGSSSSATLEFNNVSSAVTPAITAGTLVAGGTITVNINSGVFALGTPYPLLQWTSGTFTAGSFALGTVNGAGGSLSVSGNTLFFTPNALASKWTGNADAIWSATSGAIDWIAGGVPSQWINGAPALFDDSVPTANTNITLGSSVIPNGVTVNNVTTPYSITSSPGNVISGTTGLSKSGNGSLALAGGINTYTGPTTLGGGITSVGVLDNGGSPSDLGQSGNAAANLVLNGGTLQYTGAGQSSDRLFTLGTANGTIDASGFGALNLNNSGAVALSGSGARTLTLAGTSVDDNTLAARLSDNGGATALSKAGPGKWVVTANNTNSGTVTIAAGTLQVGVGGASGSLGSGNVVNNGTLSFNTSSTVTNGVISGTGAVTVDGGGTVVLPGNNTYSGATTINTGTLQVGVGGASGSMNNNANITDNGTFIYNSTLTTTINPAISGSGNVIVRKGTLQALGNNTYTGWTLIDPGATFQPTLGNVGLLASSAVTNNGTIVFVRENAGIFSYSGPITGTGRVQIGANNFNPGDITLLGSNSYTGGTFIGDNQLILGDNANPGAGAILGNVQFVNNFLTIDDNPRTLTFNRPDDFTFSGTITTNFTSAQNNLGIVQQNGSGTLTLTGNNTYGSGTVINAGTLVVGNGGTSGSIGTGPVTVNGSLIWNRSDNVTHGGLVSGFGTLVKSGAGTLTLTATNFTGFSGITTVSNGTLIVGSTLASGQTNLFPGSFEVSGGTLLFGGTPTVGVLEVSGLLTMYSGTLVATLNTSLPQSNTLFSVANGNIYYGGTLKLINAGPQLKVGQKFTLFSLPVVGNTVTIVSPGFSVQNDLAVDGSVTVTAVQPAPTISATVTGSQLNLSWPAAWIGGVHLQSQTNTLAVGLSNNWVTIPGTDLSNTYSTAINPTNRAVFYRLINP